MKERKTNYVLCLPRVRAKGETEPVRSKRFTLKCSSVLNAHSLPCFVTQEGNGSCSAADQYARCSCPHFYPARFAWKVVIARVHGV